VRQRVLNNFSTFSSFLSSSSFLRSPNSPTLVTLSHSMIVSLLSAVVGLSTAAFAATTSLPSTVTVDGVAYTWKQTVAYGEIPATAVDAFGDSLGSLGSAIAVKRWRANGDGSYSGAIFLSSSPSYPLYILPVLSCSSFTRRRLQPIPESPIRLQIVVFFSDLFLPLLVHRYDRCAA
jgi:hypothetical protein